jgi:hypothetical protein
MIRGDDRLGLEAKIPPDSTKALQHGSLLPKKENVVKRIEALIKAR